MKRNNKLNLEEAMKDPEVCPICKKYGKNWIEDKWIRRGKKLKLHSCYTCMFCNAQITDIFILETIKVLGISE